MIYTRGGIGRGTNFSGNLVATIGNYGIKFLRGWHYSTNLRKINVSIGEVPINTNSSGRI